MNKIIIEVDVDLQDLIPGYLDNRREDVARIGVCLGKRNFEIIRRLAHRMKGSGGGYGFDGITTIGAAMEQAAVQEDAGAVINQLELLRDYLIKVEVIYVQF